MSGEGDVSAGSGGSADDIIKHLQEVLRKALIHDGLVRGLHECAKALDRRQAFLCVLAENCEEESYKKLVNALCQEHQIPLIRVPDNHQLGIWAGLCRMTKDLEPKKVRKCSCVVVKDYGEPSDAQNYIQEYLKKRDGL